MVIAQCHDGDATMARCHDVSMAMARYEHRHHCIVIVTLCNRQRNIVIVTSPAMARCAPNRIPYDGVSYVLKQVSEIGYLKLVRTPLNVLLQGF